MENKQKHYISFSGGKDSSAMLFRMIELKMPIDKVFFCDTGKEFKAMYRYVNESHLESIGMNDPGKTIQFVSY